MIKQKYNQKIKRGDKTMRINRFKLTMELMRQDMTQKQLAEKAGVSRVTVNGIKSGRSCSDEVGKKIARALGVDPEEIVD